MAFIGENGSPNESTTGVKGSSQVWLTSSFVAILGHLFPCTHFREFVSFWWALFMGEINALNELTTRFKVSS